MPVDPWSHLERCGSAEAGEIGALAAAPLGATRVATAVRNDAGNLEIILWTVKYDGSVEREPLGSAEAGPTAQVAIAGLGTTSFVAAAVTASKTLELRIWHVAADGGIAPRGVAETEEIQDGFAVASFSTNRVVTAIRGATGSLKLISWEAHPDGSIERLADVPGPTVGQIAIATYDPYPPSNGALVTAVTEGGNLKVIAWSIDPAGVMKQLGDADAGPTQEVAAAAVSHRRIVTASRATSGLLEVRTWDIDGQGGVSLHSSAGGTEQVGPSLGVTTLNTARVVTAVRDDLGDLSLIVWDAIDEVVHLGAVRAFSVGRVSVMALGSDWIVTAADNSEQPSDLGSLMVTAWREHAVSLLVGSWGPTSDVPVDVTEAVPPTPLRFHPGIEGVDPMIAVGNSFVIVSQESRLGFFDKQGNLLPSKNGEKVKLTTRDFFSTFLAGKRPDGTRNEHCINRHLGFPPYGHSAAYPPSVNCDPDATQGDGLPLPPGIYDFYDTRVHFDPVTKRFFVFAPVRSTKYISTTTNLPTGKNDPDGVNINTPDNLFNRRYWAFAVSRTEDPRDGFRQWISTEAYRADGPDFTVANAAFIVAKDPGAGTLTVHPLGMKPIVYVLAVQDLLDGSRYPRSHKYFPLDFPGYVQSRDEVAPAVHYGGSDGRTFFVMNTKGTGLVRVWSFKQPSDWRNFPPIDHTKVEIVDSNGQVTVVGRLWQSCRVKFREGKLYFAWMKHLEAPAADKPGLYAIQFTRLPVKSLATVPVASTSTTDGYLYHLLPASTPDDAPGGKVSCEEPTVVVNKHGHMVVLYCRVGVETAAPLFPQVLYSVFRADQSSAEDREVLERGESMATPTPKDQLHYHTAVVDPVDDETVWMISEHANNAQGYRTVVGTVKP